MLMRKRSVPPKIVLGIGAAVLSVCVFFTVLFHGASRGRFLAIFFVFVPGAWWSRSIRAPDVSEGLRNPSLTFGARYGWPIFVAYGIWYLVNALAPETIADGITYHLGLPREYLRLGGFPDHVTFYDVVPQGMEMLYTMAYSIGRGAAAKLVEFAFFVATIPLIFRLGRRLGAGDLACLVAGFCTSALRSPASRDHPLITMRRASSSCSPRSTCSWRSAPAIPRRVLAGFCYAVELPGLIVVMGAVLYVVLRRFTSRSPQSPGVEMN